MYISTWVIHIFGWVKSELASNWTIPPPLSTLWALLWTGLVCFVSSFFLCFSLGLFTVLIVGNIVSLLTGRQKVDDLKQGVLTPLYSRSFLCKWMPKNVREKATPPSHGDIFADVVHNDAFESDENEMEEKTENKYADLWFVNDDGPIGMESIIWNCRWYDWLKVINKTATSNKFILLCSVYE